MSTKVKFNTMQIRGHLTKDMRECSCRVLHNEILESDEIAERLAESAHVPFAQAQYFVASVEDYIVRSLSEGKRLNFRSFSLYLSIKGTVRAGNGALGACNRFAVNFAPGAKFAKALGGLKGVNNYDESALPEMRRIVDTKTKKQDSITPGQTVYISGNNLFTPSHSEDEFVALEDEKGAILALGTITASTKTTLDCIFDTDIENIATRAGDDGKAAKTYLALYTRSGRDKRHAPYRCAKCVEILNTHSS